MSKSGLKQIFNLKLHVAKLPIHAENDWESGSHAERRLWLGRRMTGPRPGGSLPFERAQGDGCLAQFHLLSCFQKSGDFHAILSIEA